MRLPFLLFLCAACACGAPKTGTTANRPPSKPPEPDAKPQVVVAIIVDQLAGWIVEERVPLLPKTGGFARLRREGIWATDMRFAHAVTDTAPGHAALFTALPPRDNGIYANDLLDGKGQYGSILRDGKTRLVSSEGVLEARGSSLAKLTAETVADRLRMEKPNAFIVALSLKDRGAMFAGGRKPDASLWHEPRASGFVTSTAVTRTLPAWAAPFDAASEAAATMEWTPLDGSFLRTNALTPDDQRGEGEVFGLGRTFPHPAAKTTNVPSMAMRYTPAADALLLDLGLAAVDVRADRPMFLSISLSTHDYVSHAWGPDSWEAWDELARLDVALGKFFDALDTRVGPKGWALVLSADHGSVSMIEAAPLVSKWCKPGAPKDKRERTCGTPVRLSPSKLTDDLEEAAERAIGKGDWIAGIVDPYVYFTNDVEGLPKDKRQMFDDAVKDALLRTPGVAKVSAGGRRSECGASESLDDLICRSTTDGTTNAVYVAVQPGCYFDSWQAGGKGSSHGSPYPYDRSVPLFVRSNTVAPAMIDEAVPFESFARTLCSLLGVGPVGAARQGRDFSGPTR